MLFAAHGKMQCASQHPRVFELRVCGRLCICSYVQIHICIRGSRDNMYKYTMPKKLLGFGGSTPYTPVCLICNTNSELKFIFDLYH